MYFLLNVGFIPMSTPLKFVQAGLQKLEIVGSNTGYHWLTACSPHTNTYTTSTV